MVKSFPKKLSELSENKVTSPSLVKPEDENMIDSSDDASDHEQ